MCLAVPGKVVSIDDRADPLTGLIDFGGVRKQACLEYLPDVLAPGGATRRSLSVWPPGHPRTPEG